LPQFLREDGASDGANWLPLVLVFGSIAGVAYADFVAVTISLGYLYVLPLGISAMFLHKNISYSLTVICVFLHDLLGPPYASVNARIGHNLTALIGFAFVVTVIHRYAAQRNVLAKEVRRQRDELLQDVELAAQVQRMFLPASQPSIPSLDIAGMMQPARGVGGDFYGCIPIDVHRVQVGVADVSGKGVSAALLMSATAAALQFQSNQVHDIQQTVARLNQGIHSVSDGVRYVTLLLAEVDASARTLHYVNCGHNPGLLLRSKTGQVVTLTSSCPPVGMFEQELCELNCLEIESGDVLVFYTDGVTEAENRSGEEFGLHRLSRTLAQSDSSMSAEKLMHAIFQAAADFCQDVGFTDDVTILVVKCDFERAGHMDP
jgi:serine phosphatase RsbU (regulator of sigma subunit)